MYGDEWHRYLDMLPCVCINDLPIIVDCHTLVLKANLCMAITSDRH